MNIAYQFRAFNKTKKEYSYFDFSDIENIGWLKDLGFVDEFPIEQSTSCFDKGGALIFEGDLIEADDNQVYLVTRLHGSFVIFKNLPDSEEKFTVNLDDFTTKQYRKVGNISENPELMNEDLNQETLEKINVI